MIPKKLFIKEKKAINWTSVTEMDELLIYIKI